jgi:hypothetical protein
MSPELMERAEEALSTFATIERKALVLVDMLVAEVDLDSQVKLFLADSYELPKPLTFGRNQFKADHVARLRVIASEAMSERVRALRELGECRAANNVAGFTSALNIIERFANGLSRSFKICREEVEDEAERFGK